MRYSPPGHPRGVVLITTLLILTFLVMLATMLTTTGYNTLRRASSFTDSEQARQAALAGVAYAQMRAQADSAWMVQNTSKKNNTWRTASGSTYSGQVGNISVTETTDGNVVGTIQGSTNISSRFLISFNKASTLTAYTSENYLYNPSQSTSPQETYINGAHYRYVQPNNLSLIVEGQVTTPPPPNDPNNIVVRASRLAEMSLAFDVTTVVDAVAYSGQNMNVTLDTSAGAWNVGASDGSTQVGLRPLGNISLTAPGATDTNYAFGSSTVHFTYNSVDSAGVANTATLVDSTTKSSTVYTPTDAPYTPRTDSATTFSKVALKPTDVYSGTPSASIADGTYILQGDGTLTWYPFSYDPKGTLTYDGLVAGNYQVSYNGIPYTFTSLPKDGAGLFNITTAPAGTGKQVTLNITQPTQVVPNGISEEPLNFSFLNRDPTMNTVNAVFAPPEKASDPALLTSVNSKGGGMRVRDSSGAAGGVGILIAGDVRGTGSMLSGNDLTIQGHSVLKPAPNTGLTLYAMHDVTLQPVTGSSVSTIDVSNATQAVLSVLATAPTYFGDASSTTDLVKVDDLNNTAGKMKGEKSYLTGDMTLGDYLNTTMHFSSDNDYHTFVTNVLSLYAKEVGHGEHTSYDIYTKFDNGKLPSNDDQVFYGMVYACHDFHAHPGTGNNLTVRGVVVAYGNNPSNVTFDANNTNTFPGRYGGTIDMSGRTVNYTYDPTYLGSLANVFQGIFKQTKRNYLIVN